ncbi:MAG: hypothetical protein EPN57_27495 [Paraburkholderia sp.]|nr:MAG: hypothetical protein EPN57_27495 [Paraburkholderia sp.]
MDTTYPWISIEQNILTCPDGHRVRLHAYSIAPEFAPQVVVLGGLLSETECDELVSLSGARLQPAMADDVCSSTPSHWPAETVEHAHFARAEHDVIAKIESRIAALSQWPVGDVYGLRVTRYREGRDLATYRGAVDLPDTARDADVLDDRRPIATVVMYLNDCPSAGEISFAQTGLSVCAHKGNALFFNHPDLGEGADGSGMLGGLTLPAGETWIATKWLARNQHE